MLLLLLEVTQEDPIIFNLKIVKNTLGGVLLKVALYHGCLSRLLDNVKGTKCHTKFTASVMLVSCQQHPLDIFLYWITSAMGC